MKPFGTTLPAAVVRPAVVVDGVDGYCCSSITISTYTHWSHTINNLRDPKLWKPFLVVALVFCVCALCAFFVFSGDLLFLSTRSQILELQG